MSQFTRIVPFIAQLHDFFGTGRSVPATEKNPPLEESENLTGDGFSDNLVCDRHSRKLECGRTSRIIDCICICR